MSMSITTLGVGDAERVLAAADLFDEPPRLEWTLAFLARDGHHLLIADVDGLDVGFISGIETLHPDKGAEMLIYELGVADDYRRRGIARALVDRLGEIARQRGCHGMWVVVDPDNDAALQTYRSARADPAEGAVTLSWEF